MKNQINVNIVEGINYYTDTKNQPYSGFYTRLLEDGSKWYEGMIKDGREDGTFIYYSNGKIESEGNYKDGEREGKWTDFLCFESDVDKREENYKNGQLHGKSVEWYKNGNKKSEETYKDGKIYGKSIEYYENGNIKTEKLYSGNNMIIPDLEYHEGVLVKIWDGPIFTIELPEQHGKSIEWYENGIKKSEVIYKDGYLNGKTIVWYENGVKKMEGEHNDSRPTGIEYRSEIIRSGEWTWWYDNGNKKTEGVYGFGGMRHGFWIYYNEDGSKKESIEYHEGVNIDEELNSW